MHQRRAGVETAGARAEAEEGVGRTWSRQYTSIAVHSAMTSASVLCECRQMRTRSVPAGTVGERIGLTSKPCWRSAVANRTTASLPGGSVFLPDTSGQIKAKGGMGGVARGGARTWEDDALDRAWRCQHGPGRQLAQPRLEQRDQHVQPLAILRQRRERGRRGTTTKRDDDEEVSRVCGRGVSHPAAPPREPRGGRASWCRPRGWPRASAAAAMWCR